MTTHKKQTQCLIFTEQSIRQNPEACKRVIEWYEANYTSVTVPQLLELGLGEKADQKEYWRLIEQQIAIYNEFVAKHSCFGNVIFFSHEELESSTDMIKANSKFFTESGNECEAFIWDDINGCPIWPNEYEEVNQETGIEAKISEDPSWIDELAEKLAEKVAEKILPMLQPTFPFGVPNNGLSDSSSDLFSENSDDRLLTTKQVANIFKTAEGTITSYARKGLMPCIKSKTGRYTYRLNEVIEFFKKNPLKNNYSNGRVK